MVNFNKNLRFLSSESYRSRLLEMFLKKIISICILRKVYVRENSLNKFASAKLMESVSLKDNLQKAV